MVAHVTFMNWKAPSTAPAKHRRSSRRKGDDFGGGSLCGLHEATMRSVFSHPTSRQALRLMLWDPAMIVLISCAQGFHRTDWLSQLKLVAWPWLLWTYFWVLVSVSDMEITGTGTWWLPRTGRWQLLIWWGGSSSPFTVWCNRKTHTHTLIKSMVRQWSPEMIMLIAYTRTDLSLKDSGHVLHPVRFLVHHWQRHPGVFALAAAAKARRLANWCTGSVGELWLAPHTRGESLLWTIHFFWSQSKSVSELICWSQSESVNLDFWNTLSP